MKFCNKCKRTLPLSNYNTNRSKKDGVGTFCKECKQAARKAREHTKLGIIKRRYEGQKDCSKKRGMALPSYSLEWLIKWALSNPKFKQIYSEWARSNYETNLSPSFDRLDDYAPYAEGNIRITTWQKNKAKAEADKKSGRNRKQSRLCAQMDLDGNVIAIYASGMEASRKTGIASTGISNCCNGNYAHSGGYRWKYLEGSKRKDFI